VPSPQALVTFVTTLFVLLLALRLGLGLEPVWAAVTATLLAIALGWIVDRNVENDELDLTGSE
jgi:hypothetical protein